MSSEPGHRQTHLPRVPMEIGSHSAAEYHHVFSPTIRGRIVGRKGPSGGGREKTYLYISSKHEYRRYLEEILNLK